MEDLREADEERRSMHKAVNAQGISMQDIDRMTAERERLQKGIESAGQRLEEVKKKVSEKEVEASRVLDELERIVDQYNTVAYQTALIPSTAANAKGRNFELQVMVNDDSYFTSTNLKGSSERRHQPTGSVRTSLLALRKEISERRGAAMELMMDHDLLDGIKEVIEDKRSEVEALNHRVGAAEQEYEATKEILEQKEINTTIQYEQLVLRANALREELHTEIDRMLNDVIKFKIHIQKNLADYEGFVTDELEKELVSEEIDEDTRPVEF
ncbi:hypothetical protein B0T10DRAFT_611099 [Thelonectria olida]|uniref:Kinetochore protein NDC80 loop region domain-containing protein n=1 Tax=Thelonectria olida TaxID=1576542 RepID=A0A9P8VS58_9HYPO|nr:hypothetical protein B0T10DRAFT_611099 [Thelonectria olida]